MYHPITFNTSQVCHQLNVRHAVMSPGSRNAPLIISFARHEKITKWIIPDERSAAFIALGIAQEKKEPVILCCTSGTALLNYAPAIAEAYYREIPLIVLSADRPPELIDQRDGQTIRQFEALKNHVKTSFQLPVVTSEKSAKIYQNELIKGIQEAIYLPQGPIHINIPFKEPFYPTFNAQLHFHKIKIKPLKKKSENIPAIDLKKNQKILILIGQQELDITLNKLLKKIAKKIPVIYSPLNNIQVGIKHIDGFISNQITLKADILITAGFSILSKKMKEFIRKHKPIKHFHFDPSGIEVDTFQTAPILIQQDLKFFLSHLKNIDTTNDYLKKWERLSKKANEALTNFMVASNYSETSSSYYILNQLPAGSYLHLSNSMPVRFADLYGVPKTIKVFSNRGTSGIDGCTSTAMGTSLVSDKLNILLTGDLAFFYDINAFFNNYTTANLRIIIMNNSGGGIFRLIEGPAKLPELESYFETRHDKNASFICAENKLEYIAITNENQLKNKTEDFWKPSSTAKVMEIFTDPEVNQQVYTKLKTSIYEYINN